MRSFYSRMRLSRAVVEIWLFEVLPRRLFQEQRLVVGRSSILHWSHILLFITLELVPCSLNANASLHNPIHKICRLILDESHVDLRQQNGTTGILHWEITTSVANKWHYLLQRHFDIHGTRVKNVVEIILAFVDVQVKLETMSARAWPLTFRTENWHTDERQTDARTNERNA